MIYKKKRRRDGVFLKRSSWNNSVFFVIDKLYCWLEYFLKFVLISYHVLMTFIDCDRLFHFIIFTSFFSWGEDEWGIISIDILIYWNQLSKLISYFLWWINYRVFNLEADWSIDQFWIDRFICLLVFFF